MTREHKLALIIGFMLVMVVGVLLSDHFSHAGGSRVSRVERDEADVPIPAGTSPGPFVITARDEQASGPDPRPSALDEPTRLADAGGDPSTDAQDPRPDGPLEITTHEGIPDAFAHLFDRVAEGEFREAINLDPKEPGDRASQPDRAPADAQASPTPVQPRAWQWHTVKKGETLFSIAKVYCGNGHRWPMLAERNRSRLGEGNGVREGVRIEVPARPTREAAPAETAPDPARTRTYAVRKGDSLGTIAQRELGSARRQREILRLNRATISDADEIREGMVLVLPAS